MHSLTGCDTTSAFVGKKKKKALDLVNKRQEFLALMYQLGESFELDENIIKTCQKFVCALYGRVNARK